MVLCVDCEHMIGGTRGFEKCRASRQSFTGNSEYDFRYCESVNTSGNCRKFSPKDGTPAPRPEPSTLQRLINWLEEN